MARALLTVNIRLLAALLAGGALAGCAYLPPLPERPREVFSTPIIPRGHSVPEEALAQVTPGVSTRQDVQTALGSPSHTSTFSDNSWYYISSASQLRPGRTLAIRNQQVVAVDFAANGTVANVRRLGEQDMSTVNFVSRETPTPGNERTLLQALFGNIGRFGATPGGLSGSGGGTTTGVGVPTPGMMR
ncbi:outer membrane protein assembly factor BamE [Sabulicella rubraurantiaca]|uniref:outer membrane protein assembly factor BamE n=1 Tax=Sabulicella rubraurantiaca TaxID=2811429 RepID=UPI001A96A62A|nr:outer membrane protein assembly factor BamE [Sabulicella rubraurantiaca]